MREFEVKLRVIIYEDWADIKDFEMEIEQFNSANKNVIEAIIEEIKEVDNYEAKLICPYCNTEIEVQFPDDIVECPNCGKIVNKENAGKVIF